MSRRLALIPATILLAGVATTQTITEIIDVTGDCGSNAFLIPLSIATDGSGNVYVTGFSSDNAFKITPAGMITEIIDATGDGGGNTLNGPQGIAVDGSGNVYVSGDSTHNVFLVGTGAASPSFCDNADGSLASCPCSNPGAPCTGCDIPQATGGVGLSVLAQTTAPNGATVQGTGFATMGSPTAIVIRSSLPNLPTPVVFGDGIRCLDDAAGLVRLAATNAVGGVSSHTFGNSASAGSGTKNYQLWFRSNPSTFCDAMAAFNLSNGRSLVW